MGCGASSKNMQAMAAEASRMQAMAAEGASRMQAIAPTDEEKHVALAMTLHGAQEDVVRSYVAAQYKEQAPPPTPLPATVHGKTLELLQAEREEAKPFALLTSSGPRQEDKVLKYFTHARRIAYIVDPAVATVSTKSGELVAGSTGTYPEDIFWIWAGQQEYIDQAESDYTFMASIQCDRDVWTDLERQHARKEKFSGGPGTVERFELVNTLFRLCDKDEDGTLKEEDMLNFAKCTGFSGTALEWHDQFAMMCEDNEAIPEEGFYPEEFQPMLERPSARDVDMDTKLSEYIVKLGGEPPVKGEFVVNPKIVVIDLGMNYIGNKNFRTEVCSLALLRKKYAEEGGAEMLKQVFSNEENIMRVTDEAESCDLVYVSGGDPMVLDVKHPFWSIVRRRIQNGDAWVSGRSAGSIWMGSQLHGQANSAAGKSNPPGLSLVPKVVVPHYGSDREDKDRYKCYIDPAVRAQQASNDLPIKDGEIVDIRMHRGKMVRFLDWNDGDAVEEFK